MLFDFGESKCLHTGHGNEYAQYTMGDAVLITMYYRKRKGVRVNY